MTYPKRLIEVDLPIKRISAHARREKSIRHGHISTLHIWWARRPLAACRAVICAALWPDPVDVTEADVIEARKQGRELQPNACPPAFREAATRVLLEFARKATSDTAFANQHCSPESFSRWTRLARGTSIAPVELRGALLDFIADFANWDSSTVPEYLTAARALTQAAHEALGACLPAGRGTPGTRPLVVDPFAGGGSIPLEALRVGADAFASDLNPVAVLLNKVVLEYIPKYACLPAGRGQGLADEVRKWGEWIKKEAEKELAEFYPCLPAGRRRTPDEATPGRFYAYVLCCADGSLYKGQTDNLPRRYKQHCDGLVEWTKDHLPVDLIHFEEFDTRDGAVEREGWMKSGVGREWLASKFPKENPIAYIWARTIQCEGPGCGAEVPLVRSLWLAKKANRSVALQLMPNPQAKRCDFRIIERRDGKWFIQPDTRHPAPGTPSPDPAFDGTVKRGSATCPCCGYTTPVASVRKQLKARHGGANDARLMCVVSTRPDQTGRFYRLPTGADLAAVRRAAEELARRRAAHTGDLSLVPEEPTPMGGGSGAGRAFSQRNYGMDRFCDLFTARQALALTTLVRLVNETGTRLAADSTADPDFARAVQACLALNFSRVADLANSLCGWKTDVQCPTHLFSRQAVPMVWDFSESVCLSESSGSWYVMAERFADVLAGIGSDWAQASPRQASATAHPLPDDSAQALVTDPPYYDAVPYADLSDFFHVWLRRSLAGYSESLLSPKAEECIVDEVKGKDRAYFETTMQRAMAEGRRVLAPDGIGVVVFAHKSTAGWEAQLQAMLDAGWVVTASWPIDTEMGTRLRAHDSAALASSVHIVCRPRENPDGAVRTDDVGDWRQVLAELPRRIHEWMPRLAEEGVVGADAIFACLGPALEVFSRYSRVEKASGETVTLGEYLEQVWAAVAREALMVIFQGADATGFEEDARLTAMWLWTLRSGDAGGTEDAEDTDEEDEEAKGGGGKAKLSGFALEYDAARKIAQGLGAHLEQLPSVVEVRGETAVLLSVAARTSHLFASPAGRQGKASAAGAPAPPKKKRSAGQQLTFDYAPDFKELSDAAEEAWVLEATAHAGATVLDRLHQGMLLFAAGRGDALRRFLVEDGHGQSAPFWRLAQALSALYPSGTDEKRWVDGVLARKKGLGL